MIGLLQRVSAASVTVGNREIAAIGKGLLVLIGVQRGDGTAQAERLLTRLLSYRVWPDAANKMNLCLREINDGRGGGLLLVPQFTLAADTAKGTRASFTPAAEPEVARGLFDHLLKCARAAHPDVASGLFGADMQVRLTNDGPVTFLLKS